VGRDCMNCLKRPVPPGETAFDLIFLDPPYERGLCESAIQLLSLHLAAWIAPEGVVAAQHGRRDRLDQAYGSLMLTRMEDYSQTRIAFYRIRH
jgi:16S rRNA (guanine966-N2)-methyltransferase